MKRVFAAAALALGIMHAPVSAEGYDVSDYNLSRTLAKLDPERVKVYEDVIVPWVQEEFNGGRLIYPDGANCKRKLMNSALMRYEKVEGQDRYNIHIEYAVTINDPSGVVGKGVKGQEIVFWVEGSRIMDYQPFKEYWITSVVKETSATPVKF